ncbi:hypothetical protein Anapl_05411, partial [Anas platyrhynchos]
FLHCETCAVTLSRNTICQDIRPLKAPLTHLTTITSRKSEMRLFPPSLKDTILFTHFAAEFF